MRAFPHPPSALCGLLVGLSVDEDLYEDVAARSAIERDAAKAHPGRWRMGGPGKCLLQQNRGSIHVCTVFDRFFFWGFGQLGWQQQLFIYYTIIIYCWLQLCGPVHKIKIRFRRPQKNDFPNVFYCVRAFSPRRAILARVTRGAAEMGDAQPRKRGAVAAEDEDEVGRAHFGSGKQGGETRSPASFGCIAFPHQQRPHGPPRPSSKHGGDVGRCQTPPWPPPRQEFIPDYPHTDTGLSVMIILMPRPGVRERGPV